MKDIKVCLFDFDGTLVTKDILTLLCGVAGKLEESRKLNDAFIRGEIDGLDGLISRINFLSGMTNSQITDVLDRDSFIMPGAKELLEFLKEEKIITILASGNIPQVLGYYQKLLGIDYIVGPQPEMDGEKIVELKRSSFSSLNFKKDGIEKIISSMNLSKENIMAIGDGPGDKQMFEISGYNIAFNPTGDIADFADEVVRDDLSKVIGLIKA